MIQACRSTSLKNQMKNKQTGILKEEGPKPTHCFKLQYKNGKARFWKGFSNTCFWSSGSIANVSSLSKIKPLSISKVKSRIWDYYFLQHHIWRKKKLKKKKFDRIVAINKTSQSEFGQTHKVLGGERLLHKIQVTKWN